MDRLYTILLEYRGGIYPYQIKAKNEYEALKELPQHLNIKKIDYFGEKKYNELVKVINSPIFKPVKMANLANVWIWVGIILGEGIWVHIILSHMPRNYDGV